jgi:hypothetical protein
MFGRTGSGRRSADRQQLQKSDTGLGDVDGQRAVSCVGRPCSELSISRRKSSPTTGLPCSHRAGHLSKRRTSMYLRLANEINPGPRTSTRCRDGASSRNPFQDGFAILEDTGRKPCVLAMEDSDQRRVNRGLGGVLVPREEGILNGPCVVLPRRPHPPRSGSSATCAALPLPVCVGVGPAQTLADGALVVMLKGRPSP